MVQNENNDTNIICGNKQSKIEMVSHNRRSSVRYKYMSSEIQISRNYTELLEFQPPLKVAG